MYYELTVPGLQTPRLKRLAEIVSQQAMAQQEKLEFEQVNGDAPDGLASTAEEGSEEESGSGSEDEQSEA